MSTTPQPPNVPFSPSERCARLLRRAMNSHATMSSALELPRVTDVLKERITRSHLTGESFLLSVFSELKVPDSFVPSRDIPQIAKQMAEQSAVNLELIISAATVVLSHSTADDVFTGVCEMAMELSPNEWISELKQERSVPLRLLIEKGREGVIADELASFRSRLGNKSLPGRAEMLFRHIAVQQHKNIPQGDPAYFRISALKEADELRNSIVHGSGLPHIDRNQSKNAMYFLHEAAFVALRSVVVAYTIPNVWDHFMDDLGAAARK
jgi:hypothetical protein